MTPAQIRTKILDGIRSIGARQLTYISGSNYVSSVSVEDAEHRISAKRGTSEQISIAFDKLDSIVSEFATGHNVNVDAVFQGSGNVRSAFETILVHLPNIGYLPANKKPNKGPKKIVWFDDEIHPLGETLDVSDLLQNRGAAMIDAVAEEAEIDANSLLIELLEHFLGDVGLALLQVEQVIANRLASCFLSKRFLILTGLAGSGKTKLAQAFSRWIVESPECYKVVPVGADWTGNENILGYPDGLQPTYYVAKPALDLILHATEHSNTPHFLILDEMNLSHVERYFADILSLIESDEGLELYSGDMEKPDTWRQTATSKRVPPKLKQLPQNLFIIGTVNVDETTYMFSPKVLDRANVIEFRMNVDEMEGFLIDPAKPDLAKLDGKGATFGKAFVDAASSPVAVPADAKADYDAELLLFFKTLQGHGAEFGYRTAYETARFMHFYKLLGNYPDDDTTWFPSAFDCVVVQKFLPKLHGSRAKLGPVLKKLWFLCVKDAAGRGADALKSAEAAARSTDKQAEPSGDIPADAPYPLSAEKIGRMWRLLLENGFASFAEA